ncbi:MAG TPA: CopD family protein [Thermodesulfobacteriota bacterium]|nr:CopD family protein [Thermodesulfobacteriota bacterium]
MMYSRILIVLIHVLAAIVWLGGMFFIALVIVPSLKKIEPAEKRFQVLSATARRFRTVSWIAIPILLVTGVLNAMNRGVTIDLISSGMLFSSLFGQVLTIKVTLVFVMIILSAIHDFVLGPRLINILEASNPNPGSASKIKRYRKYVSWLARVNALLAILVVACGVMLS